MYGIYIIIENNNKGEIDMKAMAILIGLVGYTMAVKVMAILKMLKVDIEGWEQKDFEELLQNPKFLKYMR